MAPKKKEIENDAVKIALQNQMEMAQKEGNLIRVEQLNADMLNLVKSSKKARK